jgi:hypothetical protein
MHHRRNEGGSLDLPDWIFDVDDIDDIPDINILQELDVDAHLIYSVILWMTIHPWYWFFCSSSIAPRPHPLSSPASQKEFWGPCGVVRIVLSDSCLFAYLKQQRYYYYYYYYYLYSH